MIDAYLVTAPILLLGIVILLRFVGCGFSPTSESGPTQLLAVPGKTVGGNAQVALSWIEDVSKNTDSNTSDYSYQIYRSNDNLPPILVGTIAGTTSYPDHSNLTFGVTYTYTVTLLVGGTNYGTTNEAFATPTNFTNRPPGDVLDSGNRLATNLIGLYLMNEGTTESMQGMPATTINLVDMTTANPNGNAPPTWQVADPSIQFSGGASLNSYLDAGVDLLFDDMPTSMITIVASVSVTVLGNCGICEKNDGKPPNSDSGFIFALTSGGALHAKVELSTQSMVLETNPIVTAGPWVQLAFTWDGTQYNAGTQTAPSAAGAFFVNYVKIDHSSALPMPVLNANTTHDGHGTLDTTRISNSRSFRIGNAAYDFPGSLNGKI